MISNRALNDGYCWKIQLNLRAVYDSNLVGTRGPQKVNGYQEIFEEFLYATRCCHDLKNDDGSIHDD